MGKTKKIERGKYEYRGYVIQKFGYYHPEHRVCWEVLDSKGDAVEFGFTKKQAMRNVDYMLDKM